MKYFVFSIRDVLVGFGPLIVESSIPSAVRNFSSLSGSSSVPFKDFELYRLGEYDSSSGLISALSVPELVVRGSDILVNKEVSSDASCESL